jgi:DNA-binding SARP family transcriptional activator
VTDELQFELLGGVRISRHGAPLTGFASRKVQALLCYLAVTGRPHHREALAGLLWGEVPEAAAQTSLRQALANLRKLAGDHQLTDRTTIGLAGDDRRTAHAQPPGRRRATRGRDALPGRLPGRLRRP